MPCCPPVLCVWRFVTYTWAAPAARTRAICDCGQRNSGAAMQNSKASMPATGTAGTGSKPHNLSWSSPKPRRSQGNARLVAAQYFARPDAQSQPYQRRPQPTHSTTRTDATAAQRRRCGSSRGEPRSTITVSAAARASRSAGPCGSSEMPAIAAPPGREQPAAGCPSFCRASATGRDETGSPGASARAREPEDRLPSGRADSRARALETRSISGSAGHGFSRAQQRLKRRGRQ